MAGKTKIKCPFCEGEAVLSKANLALFSGAISLPDNPIYECIQCKEKFSAGKMVDATLERAKKEFNFTRQIISTGGSLGITFPPDLSEYCNLERGENIKLVPKSKKEISMIIE
ncbi:MAG: hypothetical protein PHD95_04635 [Candidatus ainarchaeum sp.]|nr:hypothetical protein [Candidatus ainarchaeum sp.]